MNTVDETSAEVIGLLTDPATYGGAGPVRRIDTHAAIVFLAGSQAIKLKRTVRFPFLDYSTLELRRRACAREIELNRDNAPTIYRDVVAVTREADGHLALAGTGEPVDWVVRMHRFDETQTLDRIAERGPLPPGLAEELGAMFADAHRRAPAVPEAQAEQWVEDLETYVSQNKAAFLAEPDLFPPDRVRMLNAETNALLQRLRPLLLQRGRIGLVRRCHGDGHLGNIALIDGRPVLFDAIEFDDRIATGDVLYDFAFVLMDLSVRGHIADANRALNRYLASTHRLADLEDLGALPLYLIVRAGIRAKIAAARRHNLSQGAAAHAAREAVADFAFCARFLEPAPPELYVVGGLSGTGKSTVARALAPDLGPPPGAVVLRSDVERKLLYDVDPTDRLPPQAYGACVTREVYGRLCDKARTALAGGRSVVVDAVFALPEERDAIARVAGGLEVPCHGFWLEAPAATLMARVRGRVGDASDADTDVVRRQLDYETGEITWARIHASGPPDATLAALKAAHARRGG